MIKGKWKLTNDDYYLDNGKHERLIPTKLFVFRTETGPRSGMTSYFPSNHNRVTASSAKTIRNRVPVFENKYKSHDEAALYDKLRVT